MSKSCVNINSVEYKQLIAKGFNPIAAQIELARINSEIEGSNAGPSFIRGAYDLVDSKSVISFKNSNEYTEELKSALRENIELLSENDAVFDYLKTGKIRNVEEILNDEPDLENFVQDFVVNNMTVEEIVQLENQKTALDLAVKMTATLGVDRVVISKFDFEDMFPGRNPKSNPAFFKNGVVYLVDGMFNDATVFHEFSHPVVKALSLNNPELFDSLYADFLNQSNSSEILKALAGENELEVNSPEYKREALVRALESEYKNPTNSSFINSLLYAFKRFLRTVFGKKINISDLNVNTSIKDLVKMLTDGSEFEFDSSFVLQDDIVEFNTTYDSFISGIEAQSLKQTQEMMDSLYMHVEEQVKALKGDLSVYGFAMQDLINESGNGALELIKKNMNNLAYFVGNRANIPIEKLNTAIVSEAAVIDEKIRTFAKTVSDIDVVSKLFERKIAQLETLDLNNPSDDFFDSLLGIQNILKGWSTYYSQSWLPKTPFEILQNGIMVTNPFYKKLEDQYNSIKRLERQLDELQSKAVVNVMYDYYKSLNAPIIESLKLELDKYQKAGLESSYNRTYESLYGVSPAERAELRVLLSKPLSELTLEERKRMDELLYLSENGYDITKENFERIFSGQTQDASKLSGLMESFSANQDNVSSTFFMMLKNTFNEVSANVNSKRQDLLKDLQPLLKAAGYDNQVFGEGALGNRLSHVTMGFKTTEDGQITQFEERHFLSNFKNAEYDRQVLLQAISKAKDQWKYDNSDVSKQAYYEAQEALEEFDEKYMTREHVNEYYEALRILKDEDGRKARFALDEVYDKINLVNSEIAANPNDQQYRLALLEAWREYRSLFSEYDEFGQIKKGDALVIAKKLKDYKEKTKDFYEWSETSGQFELAFELFIDELSKSSAPGTEFYNNEVKKWLKANMTVQVNDSYYDKRSALIERRKEIMYFVNEANKGLYDLDPMYEELYQLIRPNRDEFNVVDGSQMTLANQKRITELQETIKSVTDNYLTSKGFTKEDTNRYQTLRLKISRGQSLTPSEQTFYDDYYSDLSYNAARLGINAERMAELKDINDQLSEMTDSVPTDNYLNEFHTRFMNSSVKDDYVRFGIANGFMFEEGDVLNDLLLEDLIRYEKDFVDEMLDKDSVLRQWFMANHYVDDHVLVFDLQGQVTDIVSGYRMSAAWKTSKPTSVNDYAQKSALGLNGIPSEFISNSSVMIDGMYYVPNQQYQTRNVKEEFKTKLIDRDYIDESGNLVLANVNNRGELLPRDFGQNVINSAVDGTYINSDYRKMFNEERDLFNLLDYLKNYQLDTEASLNKSSKLYLRFPSFRKGSLEQYDKNYFSRKAGRMRDYWKGAEDDYETGNNTGIRSENPYITFSHPISGNYKIDVIDVSTNIVSSLLQRMTSIEEYKAVKKMSSFSRSVERSMKEAMVSPNLLSFSEKVKNFRRYTDSEVSKNERYKQISNMIERYIDGVNLKQLSNHEKTNKIVNKTMSALSSRLSKMSFALDPIKSLRNYFGGKFQMWKKALDLNGYSFYDLIATRKKSAAVIGKTFLNRYQNKGVPVELQLLDVLNAIPDRTRANSATFGSQTLAQDFAEGNWQFFDRKYLNDSVPVHQIYALMHAQKIEINGVKKPLYELVELNKDEKIVTKDGVPAEWAISYNDDGSVKLGDSIKKLINEHESLLNKNLGIGGKVTEPDAYRYVLGKIVFTMMKFFPGMAMDRYQFKVSKSQKRQGKYRMERRRNLEQSRLEIGTYVSIMYLLQEAIDRKGQFWKVSTYSPQALRGFYQLMIGVGLQALLYFLIRNVGFDYDDDDVEDFKFDPDAERIYARIKHSTSLPDVPFVSDSKTYEGTGNTFNASNYSKLQLLNLMTAVEQEEKTFNPVYAFKSAASILTLQNALSDGGAVKEVLNVLNLITSPEDKQRYSKAAGPYVWNEKDDLKYWNIPLRLIGLNGQVLDPATTIERRYNFKK